MGFPLFFDPPASSAVRGDGAPSGTNSITSAVTPTFKSLDLHTERYKELNMLLEKVGQLARPRALLTSSGCEGADIVSSGRF